MKQTLFILFILMMMTSCSNRKMKVPGDSYIQDYPTYGTEQELKADSVIKESPNKEAVKSPSSLHIGKGKETDNMRGFDPASEDDMDDNGMQRYFDAKDDEAWD